VVGDVEMGHHGRRTRNARQGGIIETGEEGSLVWIIPRFMPHSLGYRRQWKDGPTHSLFNAYTPTGTRLETVGSVV
jgi:hypothetical protein